MAGYVRLQDLRASLHVHGVSKSTTHSLLSYLTPNHQVPDSRLRPLLVPPDDRQPPRLHLHDSPAPHDPRIRLGLHRHAHRRLPFRQVSTPRALRHCGRQSLAYRVHHTIHDHFSWSRIHRRSPCGYGRLPHYRCPSGVGGKYGRRRCEKRSDLSRAQELLSLIQRLRNSGVVIAMVIGIGNLGG